LVGAGKGQGLPDTGGDALRFLIESGEGIMSESKKAAIPTEPIGGKPPAGSWCEAKESPAKPPQAKEQRTMTTSTVPPTGLDPDTIAEEAYVYLYPLVLMDLTRRVMTNVEKWGGKGPKAPMNTFGHFREYPPLDFKAVVRPNWDTLYSIAFLDLTDGPVIVSIPDTKGRYFVAPTLTMWTDIVGAPGWRTLGTRAVDIAYVPPGWTGTLPDGVVRVDVTTPYLGFKGQTFAAGSSDYATVHALQDAMKITPLSEWGTEWTAPAGKVDPSIDMTTPPLEQVKDMSAKEFFEFAARAMRVNPPNPVDYSQVWRMRAVGIVAGEDLDFSSLDAATQATLEKGRTAGYASIQDETKKLGTAVNGWMAILGPVGTFGVQYLTRAAFDLYGLFGNQPVDAVYPSTVGTIGPTSDTHVLHFDKDELPPGQAFWSVTLYDVDGFAVPNPLDRATLSSWMDFAYNDDGSLDLYMGPNSPGKDKEANWLPAPSDKPYALTVRMYAPATAALDGTWSTPALQKLT
jgi:hypothetical protein